ncbi:MAG: 50S ribosomal protein L1 [Candidatus Micrarchaeia archaeon]|jgi:large subunit ribosomal protein L1
MVFEKKSVSTAVAQALSESKGKRKFTQSVDVAVNFIDIDFKKPENRINVDVELPFAPRQSKVAIFADGQMAVDAKKVPGIDMVITPDQIASYASDKKKQEELLQYSLLSAPALMAVVGKQLGQVLGARGKLPKPVMPNSNLGELAAKARKSMNIKSKGKYLPCVHCIVGKESMPEEQIIENVTAVLDAIKRKVADPQIKSVYIKTTMGKPVKIAA